jgi:hypothetical protein
MVMGTPWLHLAQSKIVAILHHLGQQFLPGLSTRSNNHILPEEGENVDPNPSVGNNMTRH